MKFSTLKKSDEYPDTLYKQNSIKTTSYENCQIEGWENLVFFFSIAYIIRCTGCPDWAPIDENQGKLMKDELGT